MDAPEWHEMLPAQRRIFKRLAQKADDDGVVRMQMSTRKLGEYTDHSPETVRKMLRWLERDGKIRRSPGTGRERSRYAIPPAWGMAILDPLTPAASPVAAPSVVIASPASTTTTAVAPAAPADGSTKPTGTSPGQLVPDSWCPAARARGYAHAGRRCCGLTTRQVKAAEQKAARERAAEQERTRLAAEQRALQLDEQGRVPAIDRGLALVRAELKRGPSRVNGGPEPNGA
jgi:hypothetical protein